ncbi:hypothetical protein IEO21_10289 [Rhodonia placenta]|uniref:Reverse transcriptase domain-containing protein n=1 Tax=Rhodonia placenta TaxID=104341 RepID=A0A8H7NT53_9APHY|nr:hypothetical protein IEO21_10289 [Postia placenta]
MQVVVPGRAVLLTIPWHIDLLLRILNVYAPNDRAANAQFWTDIHYALATPKFAIPDVLLGDFNVVTDGMDHLPSHPDPGPPVNALQLLLDAAHLTDGWQTTFPDTRAFSYLHDRSGSQSRIDRIYVTNDVLETATDWAISPSHLCTDHSLVSVAVVHRDTPFVGPGRWTLPMSLLVDRVFMHEVDVLGRKLELVVGTSSNHCLPADNPQTHFKVFKDAVLRAARLRARIIIPVRKARIQCLQADLDLTLSHPNIDNREDLRLSTALLQKKVDDLITEGDLCKRQSTTARHRVEAECMSKYWSNLSKPRRPRDVIYSLAQPGSSPLVYETRSDRMASLTRDYHSCLQDDRLQVSPNVRTTAIHEVLATSTATLSAPAQTALDDLLHECEVDAALDSTESGRATGDNSLPYEFWKTLRLRFNERRNTPSPPMNCTVVLTLVYNDIMEHGVCQDTGFADGWLCPLYKKKDCREVSNYRPITLLNSDYKLFTKALSIRLVTHAPSVLNEDQAGFLPGRSIFDQVKLAKLMVDYAEAVEQNGVIVALDQEKAYDRISHDYLWATLQRFGVPPRFLHTVQALYSDANTSVILNGVRSSTYRVTRGVRQGDPCRAFYSIWPLNHWHVCCEAWTFRAS